MPLLTEQQHQELVYAMAATGLSYKEMSYKTGLSKTHIEQIKAGRAASVDAFNRIRKMVGLPLEPVPEKKPPREPVPNHGNRKGCRKSLVDSIMTHLTESDSWGLAALLKPRVSVPKPAPPPEPESLRPLTRVRKIRGEVKDFVVESHGLKPREIVSEVRKRFGVTISESSVYKVWSQSA